MKDGLIKIALRIQEGGLHKTAVCRCSRLRTSDARRTMRLTDYAVRQQARNIIGVAH